MIEGDRTGVRIGDWSASQQAVYQIVLLGIKPEELEDILTDPERKSRQPNGRWRWFRGDKMAVVVPEKLVIVTIYCQRPPSAEEQKANALNYLAALEEMENKNQNMQRRILGDVIPHLYK